MTPSVLPQADARRVAVVALPGAGLALAAGLAVLALVGAGCSKNKPTGPGAIYSSIVIAGPDTVAVGGNGQFTATVIDTGGNPVASPNLTWTSSIPAAATINNAGHVQGVGEGDVTIQARGGGASSNVLALDVYPGPGWLDQSAKLNTVTDLNGVAFTSAREGWAVGALGLLVHTTDAGKTWLPVASNSTGYTLNAIAFASPTRGIIVGSAGRILVGQSGTWTPLTGVDTDNLRALNGVYFQDAFHGWIVGNAGLILRTVNGGASWTRVLPAATNVDLESVYFPAWKNGGTPPTDPYGRGWAVGATGTILGSTDFGQTWHEVASFNDHLYGVARLSEFEAIAVGHNNRILTTFNQADSAAWQASPSILPSPFTNLEAVAWPVPAVSPGSAWAVGKRSDKAIPVVLWTTDGGTSWTDQPLPGAAPLSGNGLTSVSFVDQQHGWAVGTHGLVLHTVTGGRP